MAKVYESIDGRLKEFVLKQPMFFVATAAAEGHVNLSPKGMQGSFVVLDGNRVAYLDYTGSGVETIAHLRDNGRITFMFCAFEGPPNIVRLQGRGEAVLPADPRFADLLARFDEPHLHGLRSIIVADVQRVADSCGYAVPRMQYVDDRPILHQHHARKSEEDLVEYRKEKNALSIDGYPGLP